MAERRFRRNLPPALTFLSSGGGRFVLHDAEVLALVVDDAGQVVLRLHQSDYYRGVDLTITYAHARLMGITDDEREEINSDGASIYGDELDASADGRFVHRFQIEASWYEDSVGKRVMLGRSMLRHTKFQFAIEFDDAAMSLHVQGRLLDLGQPKVAIAAVEEMIAPLRQRVAANPDHLVNKRRLDDLVRLQEALAAAALEP